MLTFFDEKSNIATVVIEIGKPFHTIFMIHTVNHVYPKNEAENRCRIPDFPAG